MTLRKAIEKPLIEKKRPMSPKEIASTSLQMRLWKQGLNAQGHATLFRSVAALLDKSNKKNDTFEAQDEAPIRKWLQTNLEVNCIATSDQSDEHALIHRYRPLLSIESNPDALDILRSDRAECVAIANKQ